MMIVGACTGTFLRWGIASNAWGLLAVNSLGSLIAGFVVGMGKSDSWLGMAVIIGFCGSLTTFSGFALTLTRFFQDGEFFKLALHFVLNNAMCLSMCYIGWLFAHNP